MLKDLDFTTDTLTKSFFGYNKEMVAVKLTQIKREYDDLVSMVDNLNEEIERNNQIIREKDEEIKKLESLTDGQDVTITELNSSIKSLQEQLESIRESATIEPKETEISYEDTTETTTETDTYSNSYTEENTDNDEDILIGEIEDTKRNKIDESHLIGSGDDGSDDFEFL